MMRLADIMQEEWFNRVLRKKGLVAQVLALISRGGSQTLLLSNGFFSFYLPNGHLWLTEADLEGIESEGEFETLLEWKLAFG